ncbi:hypothetical protein B0H66DRAFT_304946 [Apodospora peruviana]|uniref:Tyrosinase copper-binding domain-containing protein n=1 Tax=Apodospora peruviana TaxID=516989 RepID=A0AAE0I1G2_9PEZI|nr:hypothetical protein B0H66DRAFT_304946 [Apodospora peruviana]
MKFSLSIIGLLPLVSLINATTIDPEVVAARKNDVYLKQYQDNIMKTLRARKPTAKCTERTLIRRKEWSRLSKSEKLAYVAATKCLAAKPNQLSRALVPGVRNRYDDFTAVHLANTPYVHFNGNFLAFHRHYVHLYEQALRNECGYKGTQPYWDWSISYQDVRTHPIFDGSAASLGGNGAYEPDRENVVVELAPGIFQSHPPATGGGCVTKGPFTPSTWSVNLGPIGYNVSWDPIGPDGGFGYNPRCLRRDFSPIYSKDSRPSNVTALLEVDSLAALSFKFDAEPGAVHGAGHFQVGGIELCTYASPSDPIFWAHHAMIDRIWTVWQHLGNTSVIATKQNSVWGTGTNGNNPPSAPVTLDSTINFDVLDQPRAIRELVSTIDGPFCYMYE